MDNTEFDIVSITNTFSQNPAGVFTTLPFGSASNGVTSTPMVFPVWITLTGFGATPDGSGITVNFANPLSAMRLSVHVKSTDPINNGDIDFTVMVGNIFHVNASTMPLVPGMWAVASTGLPFFPVTSTITAFQSQFYATFPTFPSYQFAFGVEHLGAAIPEPASVALMGGGLACLLIGLGIRRRRQSPEA